MKGERFLEEMEQIDPELVKEAETYRGNRNRRKKQLAAIIAAAAAVILAVGLGVGIRIRRNSSGEHWETKYVYADGATVGEDLLVEKPWEEMSLPERYREFRYRNCVYSVRAVAGAERAGEKLADISVEGQNPFTGEIHGTEAELFRLNAWSEDAAVLIRFSESPEYYTAVNLFYLPKTLESMLSDLNAEEALLVPGYTDYLYYDSGNQAHRIVFEYMTKDYLLSFLMKYADAPGEEMMTMAEKDPASQVSYMGCMIGEAELGRENAWLHFTATGYIWTNLIDRGIAFFIGEEAVKEYEQYLKENLHGYEYVYVSQPNPETKEEETEETSYETREMPTEETVPETLRFGEGIYMKTAGDRDPMIYIPNSGPCYMFGLTDEMKAVLEPLSTGDVILADIDLIMESYPGQTYPKGVKFVRKGEESLIPEGEIEHLRTMGHMIIDSGHPTGLPNFEFSLSWGAYRQSSYDSASGKLVKTTDATHPEDYETTHMLTEEERGECWTYLMNSNYMVFPQNYDPDPNMASEPPSGFSLSVTCEGETKRVDCSDTARDRKTCEPGINDFFDSLWKIAELLMGTEEFQALPDYEFYYE